LKKVGIIGCGAIGTLIAEAVETGTVDCDALILYDYNFSKEENLARSLSVPVKLAKTVDEMIRLKPTIIVEAASQEAAKEYVPKIASEKIPLIVMSVGALLGLNVDTTRIHVPSGAIGGLDAISSAALTGIEEVVLRTRKNPKILDMDNREETLIFDGGVREAVKLFPREMNVAATLALTVGSEKVAAKVISDPKVVRNVHEIEVKWKYGLMHFRFDNDPHPENPKTSALAAWSAIKLLKDLLARH
jgi:aspartate dehydrogenase